MKILKAIGGVFVKIWRWIKNTAWVQPLLIVGTIFGVIFSIPAITRGIQNLINSNNSADNFYGNYKKSMSGGASSAADQLLDKFVYYYNDNDPNKVSKMSEDDKRYFLYFTKTNNAEAREAKDAFVTLKDNWEGTYTPGDGSKFKLYTIYTDESTSETTKQSSAFSQFLERQSKFFEIVAAAAEHTNYYISGGITKTDIQTIESCDESQFKVPTMIYVDWTKSPQYGVNEVFFSIVGSNQYEKATFLRECWTATGKHFGGK